MRQYTLTAVDTAGIQDYIFCTNNLKQNVGASYLVDCATRRWVVDSLPQPHNVLDIDDFECPFNDKRIEDGELKAEVAYIGGGNALILFADHSEASAFCRRLTRRVLAEAPGLNVVLAHMDFKWEAEPLGGKTGYVKKLLAELAKRKMERTPSFQLLGLGVTASCAFTDLPAVGVDGDKRLISPDVQAKLQAEEKARRRLETLVDYHGFEVPTEFDDFGRTSGTSSYLAIIHADGNGIGSRIRSLRNRFVLASQNRAYISEMRKFSLSLQKAARDAIDNTVKKLVNSIQINEKDEKTIGPITLKDNRLPFRPIVFGGDDATFVCEGRLGLTLASEYLKELSSQTLSDGEPVYARAGVAVVRTHYPFSRAYSLAEALCSSAKKYVLERQGPPYYEKGISVLDWHFATGGLERGLDDIRQREYTVNSGKLLMRPIRLTDPEKDWRSWDVFSAVVREFNSGEWEGHRNKIFSLRDYLRDGPDAVKHFLAVNAASLPPIAGQPDMALQGWQADRCGYFDAIEAMDFFVPLEGGGK